jgi:uncharacterized membrane protein YcaP (DUF421 family)
MSTIIRAIIIYVILLIVFRLSGKRTLSHITTFDFVLLLIIGEATAQALLGEDFSLTAGLMAIVTLVSIDIGTSLLKQRSPKLEKLLDGVPLVIVENGKLIQDRADKARVDEEDVLMAARESHGLERMDQIKYAVLERSGGITVIPKGET